MARKISLLPPKGNRGSADDLQLAILNRALYLPPVTGPPELLS